MLLGIAVVACSTSTSTASTSSATSTAGCRRFGLPDVSLHDFGTLASGGVAVMLVGFAEGLGAAKTYAAREHYEIDTNRELLGLGGANLAAGLSSGMVVNGSLSKTAVNGSARRAHAALRADRRGAHGRHAADPHRRSSSSCRRRRWPRS